MNLAYVTLYVSDLALLRDWYVHNLGLSIVWQSPSFVLLKGTGGAMLGLHQGAPLAEPERVQLHFEVPDVDALYETLYARGLPFRHGPQEMPWGVRMAALRDPAGHTVELYTPLPGRGFRQHPGEPAASRPGGDAGTGGR